MVLSLFFIQSYGMAWRRYLQRKQHGSSPKRMALTLWLFFPHLWSGPVYPTNYALQHQMSLAYSKVSMFLTVPPSSSVFHILTMKVIQHSSAFQVNINKMAFQVTLPGSAVTEGWDTSTSTTSRAAISSCTRRARPPGDTCAARWCWTTTSWSPSLPNDTRSSPYLGG